MILVFQRQASCSDFQVSQGYIVKTLEQGDEMVPDPPCSFRD